MKQTTRIETCSNISWTAVSKKQEHRSSSIRSSALVMLGGRLCAVEVARHAAFHGFRRSRRSVQLVCYQPNPCPCWLSSVPTCRAYLISCPPRVRRLYSIDKLLERRFCRCQRRLVSFAGEPVISSTWCVCYPPPPRVRHTGHPDTTHGESWESVASTARVGCCWWCARSRGDKVGGSG